MLSILSSSRRLCLKFSRKPPPKSVLSIALRSLSLPISPPAPPLSPPICKQVLFSTTPPAPPTPVYSGPLSRTIRLLKLFSVTTAALTLTLSPFLVYFGNPGTPLIARAVLTTVVLTVGVSTTLLLHWFMKSYVTRLYYDRGSGQVTAFTFDMIGREKENVFHLSEATPPVKATTLSTFQVGDESYFLHADIFEDVELLKELGGPHVLFDSGIDMQTGRKD